MPLPDPGLASGRKRAADAKAPGTVHQSSGRRRLLHTVPEPVGLESGARVTALEGNLDLQILVGVTSFVRPHVILRAGKGLFPALPLSDRGTDRRVRGAKTLRPRRGDDCSPKANHRQHPKGTRHVSLPVWAAAQECLFM